MTDEMQIQSTKSNGPALLGGVLGGATAGYVTQRFTKPKYGSYDQIIKDMKPDEFTKAQEAAPEEFKDFFTEAKALREAEDAAGKEWEAALADFKAANATGVVDESGEAYQALKKAAEDAKANLEAANAELAKAGTTTKTTSIFKAINHKADKIFEATKAYEKLKAENAPEEAIKAARAKVEQLEAEANELCKQIAEKMEYTGKGTIEAQKEAAARAYRQNITDNVNKKLKERVDSAEDFSKLIKNYTTKQGAVKAENDAFAKALKDISDIRGTNVTADVFSAQSNIAYQNEVNQLKRLENLKGVIEKAKKSPEGLDGLTAQITAAMNAGGKNEGNVNIVINLLNGKPLNAPVSDAAIKEAKDYISKLPEGQQKVLQSLLNGEITETNVAKAIEQAQGRQKIITDAAEVFKNHEANLRTAKQGVTDALKEIRTASNDPQAIIKDGVLKHGKGYKKPATPAFVKEKLQLPSGVKVPQGVEIEYTASNAGKAAKEAVANAQEAFNAAEAARKAAFDKLPKVAANEEEVAANFAKSKGVADKADFVKKQVEEKATNFKEKFAKQLEGKLGANAGWKLAGIAAAGALVGYGIFKALTPSKTKEA